MGDSVNFVIFMVNLEVIPSTNILVTSACMASCIDVGILGSIVGEGMCAIALFHNLHAVDSPFHL